ncbi:MAG: ABC transporter permease, partial [Anaeroplasmataceae bacterium]|nr:ABC transporter permease [Anaeroplasmataceae bacterium]
INVIILCSGALAVIVIYNLTNINIQERIKEIATLKVIGYQRFEVLSYIYKEILIMSVFGILFGFVLGPVLDYFVMDRISSPGTYFSLGLSWEHFIYSFLITILFVLIVFVLFIPKVKKIKMVESLKSVE